MKKLLSLPPNLVDCFHDVTGLDSSEWFCTCDPLGTPLGSGGGTTHLLKAAFQATNNGLSFDDWLSNERRLILHAGGQSRRLPAYAPLGARTASLSRLTLPANSTLRANDGGRSTVCPHNDRERRCLYSCHRIYRADSRCRCNLLRIMARSRHR